MQKMFLQEWSPTALQLPEHNGIVSTVLSPKDGPKDDYESLPHSFLSRRQVKGLNPSAKSSFAAANTTAYYSLICPDPGLMQDSPRPEQRVEREGNHFIISGAPPELSPGI